MSRVRMMNGCQTRVQSTLVDSNCVSGKCAFFPGGSSRLGCPGCDRAPVPGGLRRLERVLPECLASQYGGRAERSHHERRLWSRGSAVIVRVRRLVGGCVCISFICTLGTHNKQIIKLHHVTHTHSISADISLIANSRREIYLFRIVATPSRIVHLE